MLQPKTIIIALQVPENAADTTTAAKKKAGVLDRTMNDGARKRNVERVGKTWTT